MSGTSLRDCVADLERTGQLVRIDREMDPHLEMAELHRRVYEAGGPAVFYERVKGSPFPAVSNLFGTLERSCFLLRHTLDRVKRLIRIKADPVTALRHPLAAATAPLTAFASLPKKTRSGPVLECTTTVDKLPQIKNWPDDGGPFITLPQVYTEDPSAPKITTSNLGMYRVQMAGNDYAPNREVGLHYQIHRGIGIHHSKARDLGVPLKVSVFVGGHPAATLAAIMPLPEGLSELLFAGMLAGRRFRYTVRDGAVIASEADFCITGTVDPTRTRPEGPFGDHLGYYSLAHEFPVLSVDKVYHRKNAIWPFTVVGRPPQEDTTFGKLIHELVEPMVPIELPGVHRLHAVDEAGVHPLLLALASERYVPFEEERRPQEILTLANSILGFGQASLAKYLFIAAKEDDPDLDLEDLPRFFRHVLERVDLTRDLHFQTRTTIDTLDYSGTGLNQGSKVVVAAAGPRRRNLKQEVPQPLRLPEGFKNPATPLAGILVIEGPAFRSEEQGLSTIRQLTEELSRSKCPNPDEHPVLVVVDDSEFASRNLRNFLWVTFTRSNPSHDVHGIDEFTEHKHWGCRGSLVIDARIKPHHAPPLIEDAAVTRRVEELAEPGQPLHGIL